MANTILHKRSTTAGSVPTAAQLALGELALNLADEKVFMENSSGTVVEVSYRDARVDAHLSGGTGVTYSSGTISIGQAVGTTDNVTFATVTADVTGDLTGNVTGNVTGTVSDISNHDTDSLTEGSTNLYYTDARARAAVSASGSLSYDANTGVISYTTPSTSSISEGTNLYYTDARARAAISVTDSGGDGSLSYNSSTGAITYTGPSAAEVRAHFSAGTGVSISSGAISIGQAVGTTDNVTFNNVTVNGTLTSDDITSANISVSGNATITGNLTVSGTTTTVNSNTVSIGDSILTLNSDETGNPTQDAGIEVERGTGTNVTLVWDETNDRWTVGSQSFVAATFIGNLTGNVTGTVSTLSNHDTADLAEGTNLYYTDARARAAISVSGSLSYNSSTGVISYTTPSTSGISEGTNLYYTDARARGALSFTAGSGAYNSSTGVITIPTNTSQLTNGANFIIASSTTTGTHTGAVSTSSACSTGALSVTGAITATGEITAYFSDERLKTNIVGIEGALAKVQAIRGVEYQPNETALSLGVVNERQVGVLAQEVEAVMPLLVTNSGLQGYKTVRYDKITALLIEAVKELSAKVASLEAQLNQ